MPRWLIAGTPAEEPYPCRCAERRYGDCHPKWCPCSGRTDLQSVPADCCAHRFTPGVAAAAQRGVS